MKISSRLFIFFFAFALVACSTVQKHFPDKTREYQFSSEIPELIVPSDLQNQHTIKRKPIYAAERDNMRQSKSQIKTVRASTAVKRNIVELVEYAGGAPRLRLEQSALSAWRYVGKALSRNSIEIIRRDESQLLYEVQYQAGAQNIEDGSLWDEVLFLFGDDPAQEQQYRIRLQERTPTLTEIMVVDENDAPHKHSDSRQLLNLIQTELNKDFAK